MPDQKPPRLNEGERATLQALLQYQRDSLLRKGADGVVNAVPSLDEHCRGLGDDEPVTNLRWVLMHLLEETARHAGHADILRELIDGQTGR